MTGAIVLYGALPVALTQPGSAQTSEIDLELAAILFTDTYCQARADGMNHSASEFESESAVLAYLFQEGIPHLTFLPDEWHQNVLSTLEWKCPDYLPENQKQWRKIKP